tara:strand:+ start:1259 stop:2467 length:1209 start_codon:yes stop_codon:yes gene_type:complete
MLKKNNFFKNYCNNNSKYNNNLKKTKKVFDSLLLDLKNNQIPLLTSYAKNYELDFITSTVKKFSKYKNIIIIGMGGSILGTKSIYSFFEKKVSKKLFFFDNLDSDLNLKYKKIKNLNNSCFVLVSKSGNTLETITNLGAIFSKNLLKNKLVIITEIKDNALMALANKYQAEVIEHKPFIGGRYSVLSETGMFPAALMGLNLMKFKNLNGLIHNKNFISCLIKNVAAIYTLNLKKVSNSVILSYDSSLNDLGYWYQQLVSESLGKKGKGISPTLSFGPKDQHSLLQLYLDGPKDKFFTFFNSSTKVDKFKVAKDIVPKNISFLRNKNLGSIINAQCNAVKKVFRLKNIPYREITFNKKNETELGEIFTFFVLETILLSRLMRVNPFNQPAVEQVKIETIKFLR